MQTALSGADLYYWFAAGFGNVDQLSTPYASPFDVPIMGSLVSLSVQSFFVYRIWVLSERRSWWLCVIICLVMSPSESQNDLITFPVALHCRRSRGVCCWDLCESPPCHIPQNVSQLQQSHIMEKFISGVSLKAFEVVKSSNKQDG